MDAGKYNNSWMHALRSQLMDAGTTLTTHGCRQIQQLMDASTTLTTYGCRQVQQLMDAGKYRHYIHPNNSWMQIGFRLAQVTDLLYAQGITRGWIDNFLDIWGLGWGGEVGCLLFPPKSQLLSYRTQPGPNLVWPGGGAAKSKVLPFCLSRKSFATGAGKVRARTCTVKHMMQTIFF
jgi:hypothetical protein